MNIIGKKVFLRAMDPEDMDMYLEMTNDSDTARLLGGWSFPVSKFEQMEWYKKAVVDKSNLRFTVAVKETKEAIGMVNLVDIDWKNGSATHGIRLASEKNRGKGYGTDAVMSLMRYAFEELRLNRLDTTFIEYNTVSQAMYKKCGWKIEGTKQRALFREGKYYNLLISGILAEEYYDVKKRLGY